MYYLNEAIHAVNGVEDELLVVINNAGYYTQGYTPDIAIVNK